jgi:hypothetical protein
MLIIFTDSLMPSEDSAMFEALGQDNPDGEAFGKIFSQLKDMKGIFKAIPFKNVGGGLQHFLTPLEIHFFIIFHTKTHHTSIIIRCL